jgi:hypothetical protein
VTGPLPGLRVDLSRFTSAGHGTVHGAAADGLLAGQVIAVTDDDADVLEAEVLAVRPGVADLQARWGVARGEAIPDGEACAWRRAIR